MQRLSRPPLQRDVAVGLTVFSAYVVVAAWSSAGRRGVADRNAAALFAIERWAHIDLEKMLNQWLAGHPVLTVLANYEYAYTYVISAFALLGWLYVRHPDDYCRARDSFIVLNVLGIACFAVLPVTPPRMLTGHQYLDTVATGATFGSWGTPLVSSANKLAAMPSLHLAWALWVSVVLARLARGIGVQLLSAAHVAVTLLVIITTANHYVLDAVAAVPFVWVSVAVVDAQRRRRGVVVPAADAFFLHVETDTAPQHVGGMVVLAPSGGRPSVEQLRGLLREAIVTMPRFRQRLYRASRWRRWRWVDVDIEDMDWDWHVSGRAASHSSRNDDPDSAVASLSQVAAEVAMEPMPRDRPMWRLILVRDISPGRCGVLFIVHHCVADGLGAVAHALTVLRPALQLPADQRPGIGAWRAAAATVVGLAQLGGDGKPAARLPAGSAFRQLATASLDLHIVRSVAHDRGVRVTDVVLAVLAAALQATHPRFAAAVSQRLRVSLPVLVAPPGVSGSGNGTAAVMIDVPLDCPNTAAMLRQISADTSRVLTLSRILASRFVMNRALGALPAPLQAVFARTVYGPAFLQAIVSNMPGPAIELSLADVPLEQVVPILPLAPDVPVAVGALSWARRLYVGVVVDPTFLDAAALTGAIASSLHDLVGAADHTGHDGRAAAALMHMPAHGAEGALDIAGPS